MERPGRYKSADVAKYIIVVASKMGMTLNMTKLQKFLYVAYGIYLAVGDGDKLTSEPPEAWPSGPVFPTVRNELLEFKFEQHSKLSPELGKEEGVKAVAGNKEVAGIVDLVFKTFRGLTPGQLSKWSQSPGSPWDRARNAAGFEWGQAVPDDYIKEYFTKMVVKNE